MNDRKRILFVNNNMKIGGVQKALADVLCAIHRDYDVTLLLFRKSGDLLSQLPPDITVIETASQYKYLGMSQGECRTLRERMVRGVYAVIAKTLGISYTISIMDRLGRRDSLGAFDLAVSFLHCGNYKTCYGGAAEYTLHQVQAQKKACYLHCDYLHSGTCTEYSKAVYRRYDRMICVSQSVRSAFLKVLPELSEKTIVLRNPIDREKIRSLAEAEPFRYDQDYLNLLTVARLAPEKGIERVIRGMVRLNNGRLRYYIAGAGPLGDRLEQLIHDSHLEKAVFLLGEQKNPYACMAGADVLMVPSVHEAAPVVFQEAEVLGLPVVTTRTLSAEEMIPPENGLVVDNTDEAIEKALGMLLAQPEIICRWKQNLQAGESAGDDFRCAFNHFLRETER